MPGPIKQAVNIDFSKGLNLKVDPYQVSVGNFLGLTNSVFDKVGRLTKRNGFPELTPVPIDSSAYLTTFKDSLQAIGDSILSYSSPQMAWINKGSTHPLSLSTTPLIRNSLNQSQADVALTDNGLVCVVYTEDTASGPVYKYSVADSVTGQSIVAPTVIIPTTGIVTNAPRVFLLKNNFIIVFEVVVSGASRIQYIAVSAITGLVVKAATSVTTNFVNTSRLAYDAVVANGSLYFAWNTTSSGGVAVAYLTSTLTLSSTIVVASTLPAAILTMSVDSTQSQPVIWVTYYNSGNSKGYAFSISGALAVITANTQVIASGTVLNITSAAMNGVNTFFYELSNNYSYDSSIPTHFVDKNTINQAASVGSPLVSVRSVGLASKAFIVDGVIYYLAAYQSPYQPSYFLIEGSISTQSAPAVVSKLAYSNGGGYLSHGLPNVPVIGSTASLPYLFKDSITAVNKNTNVPSGSQVNGIYSQLGINLASFTVTKDTLTSVDIGNSLSISGGLVWGYDGYLPVEQNFLVWPDSIKATWATTGGHIAAQPDGTQNTNVYFYQVTYEWTDNQGNAFRSAPSIPVGVTTTGSASTGTITLNIPTLRLTYKIANPVKICVYRWSVAQQSYYQVTALTFTTDNSLTLNDTTTDSITFIDTLSDASILGNSLLYTTGGVIENISPPASDIFALFDNRMWLVDSEDRNLLWFSKQVIEATPVEMSDLLTFYVAPSTGVQGSTGNITALFPMDDKLVIFKENAIYYINGVGPDNTGANSQYSQPIFITSTVGCTNPKSIVVIPQGLMFQSNKGIWLLGRDGSTQYIGAAVEDYNAFQVTSGVVVPGTNQARFALDNGITLMFDYFVGQWGTFDGVPSISSTIFKDRHTIVNSFGQVSQESPGTYYDRSSPVLMSFKTSWLRVESLRGYQRAYWLFFLGTYLSPHKLQVSLAYDYNPSNTQGTLTAPINYAGPYGSDPYYGGSGSRPYGGTNSLENWRVFLERQRCKAVQVTIQEVFDPSFGTMAGPGLTLSGLSMILGVKKAWAPTNSNQSAG